MSPPGHTGLVGERWRSYLRALSLVTLVLLSACATERGLSGHRYHSQVPQASLEDSGQDEGSDGGGDEGETVFATLHTNFAPVRVDGSELTSALATLVLNIPLRVAHRSPLYVGRNLTLAAAPVRGETWHTELARHYGGVCTRRGSPGDCLSVFDDGPYLQDDDMRSIALALAVGPALESLDAELRGMLDPTRVLATLSITIAGYMALLLAPEPVTKGVAAAFTLLMWAYLGWEFFDLLRAYAALHEEAPRARSFEELKEVGERFGRVIGPNSVRILVLVGTAAIGETAALVSKVPKLPGFGQASRTVELSSGVSLLETATGTERIIVSMNEGALHVVLPINAVAMIAGNGPTKGGRRLPDGARAFGSFRAFKRNIGKAGNGKEWHHIVEKHRFNLKRFGAEALHNTKNVIPLEKDLHTKVSAFYSSKNFDVTSSYRLTVREWIRTQDYESQRSFGLLVIKKIRGGEW
jgi:hypothetical protein